MWQADGAEARGDAQRALELMSGKPLGPDGKPFWRPWRVRHLTQLVTLGSLLPGWVVSRWVLAQAHQSLDGTGRPRVARALKIAIDLRGGPGTLPGVDSVDARSKVVDHDWVYRQTFLYELGGLDAFLRRVATGDLLAGADQIRDWARSAMGGYRLVDHAPDTVTWEDLSSGQRHVMPNIGSSVLVVPGECVIGRRVPVEDGSMFETAPLVVPQQVARQVAREPVGWIEALSTCERADGEPTIRTGGHQFGLVSDVPSAVWLHLVLDRYPRANSPNSGSIAAATLDLARRLLADPGADRDPETLDAWPCLAAALLEPEVTEALPGVMTAQDKDVLIQLADLLAEPAASVCHQVLKGVTDAA